MKRFGSNRTRTSEPPFLFATTRVPQGAGRVQGWESVCCGVAGIPFGENEELLSIVKVIQLKFPISQVMFF